MPYRQAAEDILTRWRAAERRLETAVDDEAEALQAEIAELRGAYQGLIDEARTAQRDEPLPFPAES